MQNRSLNELREMFFKFFESKGHLKLDSSSLVPKNDSGLLLINSGMAPFKNYFTGKESPPNKRVTTCQKCIRTIDIDNVGKTSRHGTFFEMLGNFSFGDYFKKEAVMWAWQFITEELEISKDILWVTVYVEDNEAYEIWSKYTDIKRDRIVKLGKKDNFWEIGMGPCGPSSEIFIDRGIENGCGGNDCKPGCDCDRFVEIWNLVFTQFDKDKNGNYNKLDYPNIDTGSGLERLAYTIQGVNSIFEVDTIRAILDRICEIADISYNTSKRNDMSIRVITDHIRSSVMLISDDVFPSNEKRGYVLRRLIRRAIRHGKLLGIKKLFLYDLADLVVDISKGAYSELEKNREKIKKIIRLEEEKFEKTLDLGIVFLENCIEKTKSENLKTISGLDVFKLHDELGFPIDISKEIAFENGLDVDIKNFEERMKIQKETSRENRKVTKAWSEDDKFKDIDNTIFFGYNKFQTKSIILGIILDNEFIDICNEDEVYEIILDNTVFYAESGGQVGDKGIIKTSTGLFEVFDCKKIENKFIHYGRLKEGHIKLNDECETSVDFERRMNIMRNHTATHLLNKVLRNYLGDHINQAGSLVEPDKFRFDFNHFESIEKDNLNKIEEIINNKIMENMNVNIEEMNIDEAKKRGATALFDEKYGNVVRVVSIGDFSKELCGGTHIENTSQIGMIKILNESGIASGTRRIEAITGKYALDYFNKRENILNNLAHTLKSNVDEVEKRVKFLIDENKKNEKEIEKIKGKLVSSSLDKIISNSFDLDGTKVLITKINQMSMNDLRNMGDSIKNKLGNSILVLISSYDNKVNIIVTATKETVKLGINSGKIIKEIAKITGGGGGGRPDMAQAGGKDISKIDEALKKAKEIIKSTLKT
ncbi:MAG: alanine--tRNA ligase [Clostridiales bacterium]